MDRKRANVLFIIFLGLAIILTAIASHFYDVYMHQKTQPLGVYDFMILAQRLPGEHMIVLGEYAEPYERQVATTLAQTLKLRVKTERDVNVNEGMILIGTPNTNNLLDKFLNVEYKRSRPIISVSGNNLLVIVSNKEQAVKTGEILGNFMGERILLSPSVVQVRLEKTLFLVFLFILLTIPGMIFYTEGHRQKQIAVAGEVGDTQKLIALKEYINKYTKEGYTRDQIKRWLIKYEYESGLVNVALEETENAGADLSA